MDRFEKVAFLDTVGLSPNGESVFGVGGPTHPASVLSFSGLNVNDASIVSVSIVDSRKDIPGSTSASPSGDDLPSADLCKSSTSATAFAYSTLQGILSSEAIDVVLYVVEPEDIQSLITRSAGVADTISSSSASHSLADTTDRIMLGATLPILVVNKVDDVWERVHAVAPNDEDFKIEYEQWKQSAIPSGHHLWSTNLPSKFFVSSTHDSPFNDFETLESTITHLVKRRKTIKTLTALSKLSSLCQTHSTLTASHAQNLGKVDAFVHDLLKTFEKSVRSVAESETGGSYQAAVTRAFFGAMRDMAAEEERPLEREQQLPLDDRKREAVEFITTLAGASVTGVGLEDFPVSSLPKHIDFEVAKALNDSYLMARCIELGLGNFPHLSSTVSPAESVQSIENVVRSMCIKWYKITADSAMNSASSAAFSAQASLRLSHLARPSLLSPTGDAKESLRYLRLAAARGLAAAQVELGKALEVGDCVEMDIEAAKRWYSKAAGVVSTSAEVGGEMPVSGMGLQTFDADGALQLARLLLIPTSSEEEKNTAVGLLLKAYGVRDVLKGQVNPSGPQDPSERWAPWNSNSIKTSDTMNVEVGLGAVDQFEAALGLMKCFQRGIGVAQDDRQSAYWKHEAEMRWEEISKAASKRLWMILNGKDWFKYVKVKV
jgi:TPR repeat protein